MYGDVAVIRSHARALREQGRDLRSMADDLVAQVEHLGWQGRAAGMLRDRIQERAARLREVAERHDSAADALESHGAAAERVTDEIAHSQRRITGLVEDARARMASRVAGTEGVTVESDPVDEALLALELPPDGALGWLDLQVPGGRG